MERAIKEKMTTLDVESAMPQDLINAKPLTISLKDFFATSQLSQFMIKQILFQRLLIKKVSALGQLTEKQDLKFGMFIQLIMVESVLLKHQKVQILD